MEAPTPPPPPSISVTDVTMSETGKAIWRPLKIWGSAAGSTTFQRIFRSPVPMFRADQMR